MAGCHFNGPDVDFDEDDLKLITPFTGVISGPSGCGKTWLISKLIGNIREVTSPPITNVVYLYSVWQGIYDRLAEDGVVFTRDLGLIDELEGLRESNVLLIIDDLETELSKSEELGNLYTKYSHHYKISVIMIVQNYFRPSGALKVVRSNSHYVWLGTHRTNLEGLPTIARQLAGHRWRDFVERYEDCTGDPEGVKELPERFLTIDIHPNSHISPKTKYRSRVWAIPNQILYLDPPR